MNKLKLLMIAFISILFSCSKSAGVGGRSTIRGVVMVNNINILGNIVTPIKLKMKIFLLYMVIKQYL